MVGLSMSPTVITLISAWSSSLFFVCPFGVGALGAVSGQTGVGRFGEAFVLVVCLGCVGRVVWGL
ncbi:hypothetical protein COO60DRAFT_1180900 [Scenedesmus sp. NREL 46B-D3]|nr:hypothetical protein COO60DRAFT_1180900 [Scenedesmus sp. NREL 46B-D3]